MKMLLIIGPRERHAELVRLIEVAGVHAYTELTQVTGEGLTGRSSARPSGRTAPPCSSALCRTSGCRHSRRR